MRTNHAFEAKNHLLRRLDDACRGETLVITRHGRAIARIVPESNRRPEEIDTAVSEIWKARKKLASHVGKVSLLPVRAARDEGRRPSGG